MNGSQGAGCCSCCGCCCPYCSGYARGFQDGQRAARGYWTGPHWQRIPQDWMIQQQGLSGIQGQLQGQQGLTGYMHTQAQQIAQTQSLQCQANYGQLGQAGLLNGNGGQS